tara:strand:+ start:1848 stop:2114 length:267 start_codon:yes stop_codon:yes gene_type:complete
MFFDAIAGEVGKVDVMTTSNRGHTPEEIAALALKRIFSASNNGAIDREAVHQILVLYMKKAIQSDRTTVYNKLNNAGLKDAAEIIRRL